jgi:hypothetical protein
MQVWSIIDKDADSDGRDLTGVGISWLIFEGDPVGRLLFLAEPTSEISPPGSWFSIH